MTRRSSKTQRFLRAVALWLIASAVVISPWLFGSADAWAYLFLCILIGWGAVAWLLSVMLQGDIRLRASAALALLGLLLCLVLLQMTPWPPAVARLLTPRAVDIQAQVPVIGQVAKWPGSDTADARSVYLSLAPPATRRSLFLAMAYVAVFAVMANALRRKEQVKRVAQMLVLSGFIMAVLSIVHKLTRSDEIFWFHVPRYGGNVFGPFSNRNHFAAYMNMMFGLAFGLAISSQRLREVLAWPDWRDKIEWLSSRSGAGTSLTTFAAVIIGGAVFSSLSRGGILSLMVALAVTGAVAVWRWRSSPRVRTSILILGFLVAGAVVWMAGGQVFERMGSLSKIVRNPMEDFRAVVTRDTLTLYGASPVVGCGFGAFRHAYPMVQRPSLAYRWLHAHNDWAQLLAEGGMVGAVLMLLVVYAWVVWMRRALPKCRVGSRLFTGGVLVGLGTIAMHSAVDYSLHKPANALLLAAMAGLACAAAGCRPEENRNASPAPEGQARNRRALVRSSALLLIAIWTVLLVFVNRDLRGELALTRFLYTRDSGQRATEPDALRNAVLSALQEAGLVLSIGEMNSDTFVEMTGTMIDWSLDRRLNRELRIRILDKAQESAVRAVYSAPSDYLAWASLARIQLMKGYWDSAGICLARARQLVLHPRQVRMFEPEEEEPPEPAKQTAPGGQPIAPGTNSPQATVAAPTS